MAHLFRFGFVALLLGVCGCTFQVERFEDGPALTFERFQQVELGDDRGAVLEKLGPPQEVAYIDDELEKGHKRGGEYMKQWLNDKDSPFYRLSKGAQSFNKCAVCEGAMGKTLPKLKNQK